MILIRLKYLLLGAALLTILYLLSTLRIFDLYQDSVNSALHQVVRWGMIGIFLSALIANSTVIISIPYSLLVFTVVLIDHNWVHAFTLGLVAGIGAGLGRLISYRIAQRMASQISSLPNSALYRCLQRLLTRYPNHVSLYLFFGALSFLPDEIVITPVALTQVSVRQAALPLIAGKLLHTLSMIGVVMLLGSQVLSDKSHPDLILAVVLITILIMFYQIDKSRLNTRLHISSQPVNGATYATCHYQFQTKAISK